MNISLPVIDNMFAGVVAADSRRAKPPAVSSTGRLYKASTHDPCRADTTNEGQSYNSVLSGGKKLVNGSLGGSERMLPKKTAAGLRTDPTTAMVSLQTPLQGPTRTKRKAQHPASPTIPVADPAQLASAKKSLTTAAALEMGVPARPHVYCRPQGATRIPCTPIQLTDNLSSNGPKPALPSYSKRSITTDMQQDGVKNTQNTDKPVLSNAKAVATHGFVSKKCGPDSMLKTAAVSSEAIPAGRKPAVAGTAATVAKREAQLLAGHLPRVHREQTDAQQKKSVGSEESALLADKQQEGVKNADEAVLSNARAGATQGLGSKKCGPDSMPKATAAGGKAIPTDAKPAVADTAVTVVKQEAQVLEDRFPRVHEETINAHQEKLIRSEESALSSGRQQQGIENTDRAILSNANAAGAQALVGKKPGPNSVVKAAAANRIEALSDEKPPIANTLPAGTRQKAHVRQDRLAPPRREHSNTDQNASAEPDRSALPGDKSAVPAALSGVVKRNTQLSDVHFPHVHERVADTEQKNALSPEKSVSPGEKPGDNPAPINREPKPNVGRIYGQASSESAHSREEADNPSLKSLTRELNVAEFQVPTDHPKDRGRPTSGHGSSIHFTRAFSADGSQILVSEPRSALIRATKVADTALPRNVSNTVSEQIMESIRSSLQQGDRCITIRLHPPELGKLIVRFKEQEDQITGSLEVSKTQTRYEIEQTLPQLVQTLRDSGVRIERLDVLLTDQSDRQADRNHLLQDGSFQQDASTQGGNSDNKSNYERPTDLPNGTYHDNPETQVQIGDNSINMLM